MKSFLYETHLHTRTASACAATAGADYIDKYLELGYSGIIVTDHFYHGNCAVDRQLPWEEFINEYCRGYEEAKAEGDKKGLSVFFGIEENFDGDEYLIYGIDKEWLIKHPQMLKWSHNELFEAVHDAGGLVVQAHPFRQRNYLSKINIHPETVDAMEAANKGNTLDTNQLAYEYCRIHGIAMTAGNDMHNVKALCDGSLFATVTDHQLTDVMDYVRTIKSGKGFSIKCDENIKNYDSNILVTLPIYLFDYDGHSKKVTKEQLGL